MKVKLLLLQSAYNHPAGSVIELDAPIAQLVALRKVGIPLADVSILSDEELKGMGLMRIAMAEKQVEPKLDKRKEGPPADKQIRGPQEHKQQPEPAKKKGRGFLRRS